MTAVTSAPVPIACKNPAAPSKRSPKRVASKQAAGRGVSGPWSPNGDWCEAYRVQRPMPRDLRPETAVLERAINLAIWMHCPRDKQDDFRRMVNKRLRPHTGGVALFSVDKVEGAELRLFEYVMAWMPTRPELRKEIINALLEGELRADAPAVANDEAGGRYKLVVRTALERMLAAHGARLVAEGEIADVDSTRTMNSLRELAVNTLTFARLFGREAPGTHEDPEVQVEIVSSNNSFTVEATRGAGAVYDKRSRHFLVFGLEEARDRCVAAIERGCNKKRRIL